MLRAQHKGSSYTARSFVERHQELLGHQHSHHHSPIAPALGQHRDWAAEGGSRCLFSMCFHVFRVPDQKARWLTASNFQPPNVQPRSFPPNHCRPVWQRKARLPDFRKSDIRSASQVAATWLQRNKSGISMHMLCQICQINVPFKWKYWKQKITRTPHFDRISGLSIWQFEPLLFGLSTESHHLR